MPRFRVGPLWLALSLASLSAAQQVDGGPPQSGSLQAVAARPLGIHVPPPPRTVTGQLSKHGIPPLAPGPGRLAQPASPPSATTAVMPHAVGAFTYYYNVDSLPAAASSSATTEPTVAVNRDTVLQTGNWYAALSKDSGASWSHLDPYTFFTAADNGFCCDQKTIHVAPRDMIVWLLQYGYSGTTQQGRHRIAWVTGRDNLRNSTGWQSYDLTAQFFGLGNGLWLDFPDLGVTATHVYGATNVYRGSDGAYVNSVLWRAEINDFQNGGNTTFQWYTSTTIGGTSYRLTAGAQGLAYMYAATHRSTTSLRAYNWLSTGNIAWNDITVATWSMAVMSCPGPDGRDWAGYAVGGVSPANDRVLAGYTNGFEYGFLWASAPVTGRARPFTRVLRLRNSDHSVIATEDIWSATEAFLYPAACTNNRGEVGVTLSNGSSSIYPRTVGGIVDNYETTFGGRTYYVAQDGTHGPAANRWGDYFAVQRHPIVQETFVSIAKAQNGGPNNSDAAPRYIWFGRDDYTPGWVSLDVTASTPAAPIVVDVTDRFLRQNGATPFSRSYAPEQGYQLTAPARYLAGGTTYLFDSWLLNNVSQPPGQRMLDVSSIGRSAHAAHAQYSAAFRLEVASIPVAGAAITVSPPDIDNQGDGSTPFTRLYRNFGTVTLTAPPTHNGNAFAFWLVGTNQIGTLAVNLTVLGSGLTATAVYLSPAMSPRWTQVSTASRPTGNSAMAFDSRRGKTVVLSGNTTWEYDGRNWTQVSTAQSPPNRNSPRMAFDANRGVCVLFGGLTGLTSLNDTWEYDGSNWTQRFPATVPPARYGQAMQYHSASGRVIMFSGLRIPPVADTWAWNGTDWTQLAPSQSPVGRQSAPMAEDTARNKLVLFGGVTGIGTNLRDTWEFDGSNWTQALPSTMPPERSNHAMAFDRARGRTVLFGGLAGLTSYVDTWEWDGMRWIQRTTLGIPSLAGREMVFDSRRNQSVMFGTTTWEYFAPVDVVGTGHPGGGLPISAVVEPRINTTFCLRFPSSLGTAYLLLGLAPCRTPPFPVGPPSFCSTGSLHIDPLLVLAASGNPANACIPIPGDLGLVGAAFCMQGLALEGAACLRLTDAVAVVLMR